MDFNDPNVREWTLRIVAGVIILTIISLNVKMPEDEEQKKAIGLLGTGLAVLGAIYYPIVYLACGGYLVFKILPPVVRALSEQRNERLPPGRSMIVVDQRDDDEEPAEDYLRRRFINDRSRNSR